MEKYFVAYQGETPAALSINGHRVVILAKDSEQLTRELEFVGADRIQSVDEIEFGTEEQVVSHFAQTVNAHVVVSPSNVELRDLVATLERELPWIH
jgi:hypothetical protein